MLKRTYQHLLRISQAARNVCEHVAGLAKSDFFADPRSQQAVLFNLIIIDEATTALLQADGNVSRQYAATPWNELSGMRGRLSHNDFELELDAIWETAVTVLPQVLDALPAILEQEGAEACLDTDVFKTTLAHYFRYWGKAKPQDALLDSYHLLVFHSLDVAACGEMLIALPRFSLVGLAKDLDWSLPVVERLFVFFLVLHDLGKFARAFQNLAPDLSPDLVKSDRRKHYLQRHDTLGWLAWRDYLQDDFPEDALPQADDEFWADWIRTSVGHHGVPPKDTAHGGSVALDGGDFFLSEDRQSVIDFVGDVAKHFLPEDIPTPNNAQRLVLRRHAWRLAGLAVLADWLGSNQQYFPYHTQARPLADYWKTIALPAARAAVGHAGLGACSVQPWETPAQLFDYLKPPTPLQHYAATVPLDAGPQMFLLEDVTGSGKTEAALILAHRLMSVGAAQGLYMALPSMATANQMYRRVGLVYKRLYQPGATPSLILAHGARQLVDGFRQSVLQAGEQPSDSNYQATEASATTQCSAWLADSRKKALLADVGVGTVDQALLAVLPARHQSLRLLGLAGKVLVIDEVHAYDVYMRTLLKTLLTAHARQGGSAVLLSATLPASMRAELVSAFQTGRGAGVADLQSDMRYPLATQAHATVAAQTFDTREQLKRRVKVMPLHDESSTMAEVIAHAAQGKCVCWIRNTVEDARRAFLELRSALPESSLLLFHSRYAMGDRLDIENLTLDRFGKHSTAGMRRAQVLVATQVVEQSLDLDFDVMVSDLAPVDLLIQRAGRLQRHARNADGNPAADNAESRPPPVLHLLCPESTDTPKANWYAELFPKASYVYPNVGQLWMTQQVLLDAGSIVSPGLTGEKGSVRSLVEAVYGESIVIPDALLSATRKQEGIALADLSMARFNVLKLDRGYCEQSSTDWYEETRVPTRLGDESLTIYLARETAGILRPWIDTDQFAWEHSAVRIDARKVASLSTDWQARFGVRIEMLRGQYRLLEEPAIVLPLVEEDGRFIGKIATNAGATVELLYDRVLGLLI